MSMMRIGLDLLTTDASSSEVIDFNLALGEDEVDEGSEQAMALQTMPHPQLLTTGLDRGDILVFVINVVGEVAGFIGWWLVGNVLELLLLLLGDAEDGDENVWW